MWAHADLTPWDPQQDDKTKTDQGIAVPCRLCESVFGRLRLTLRYCSSCRRGFCEGEHGSVSVAGPFAFRGVCVRCSSSPGTK